MILLLLLGPAVLQSVVSCAQPGDPSDSYRGDFQSLQSTRPVNEGGGVTATRLELFSRHQLGFMYVN